MVPAIVGSARLGNFRLGYVPATLATLRRAYVRILIAGIEVRIGRRVRRGSVSIRDVLNDTPNECSLTVQGTPPSVGDTVRVLINSDAPRLLFNGELQTVDASYELKPTQLVWACHAIDDTQRLNQIRPYGSWANVSGTTVAQELVARFAPGFTATHVQAGLPPISVNFDTTEGFNGALKQIAKLIGGYFYVEDGDLHLFTAETSDPPNPIDVTHHDLLDDPPIVSNVERSQLRTRVYGKGGGSTTTQPIPVGAIEIPINDIAFFPASGGTVVSGSQRITYTNMLTGGTNAFGGATTIIGSTSTVAGRPAPASTVTATNGSTSGGSFTPGNFQWKVSFVYSDGSQSLAGPASSTLAADGVHQFNFSGLPIGDARVSKRRIFRAFDASATPDWTNPGVVVTQQTINDNTTTTFTFDNGTTADESSADPLTTPASYAAGATYVYVTDTASFSGTGGSLRIGSQTITYTGRTGTSGFGALTGIPAAGAGSVTSTIAVASGVFQNYAAGVTTFPVADTAVFAASGSGLTFGQAFSYTGKSTSSGPGNLTGIPASGAGSLVSAVKAGDPVEMFYLAGSTVITLVDTTNFSATGGIARIGFQTITYTGKSTSSGVGNLTGIPATGAGSLTSDFFGGETVLVGAGGNGVLSGIPATGAGSVLYAINQGESVNIWVQRDDLAAQALYGIHEGPVLIDERRALSSLNALCDAELALYATPIVTVTYATRDPLTKSGKTIDITLASPSINQTLTIQDVTISEIGIVPGLVPKFTVTASSVRFSIEDILRKAAA